MWLFFLFWIVVTANEEPLYRKIGDEAVLTPNSVVNPIISIVWIHGPNIAMVWHWNGDKTLSYRQFKDRGSLNTSNGALTITGLTPDDRGNYTVEINSQLPSKTELLVISPVSKPTLSLWCEAEMTYCVLTCSGSTTGAEPVTYWWTSGDTTWSSTKEHNITKEDSELWFSCAFENPVSSSSSEKVLNPFMERARRWTFICLIPLFILFGCIFYFIYKCTKPQWQFQGDSGAWYEYIHKRGTTECSVNSDEIERKYQRNPKSKMPFTVDGNYYELHFEAKVQINLKTEQPRKIRRKIRCTLL